MQAMTSHPTLCQDMGSIATLPCAIAVVRCPSLHAAINTEKAEEKRGGGEQKTDGGVCFLDQRSLGKTEEKGREGGRGEEKSSYREGRNETE